MWSNYSSCSVSCGGGVQFRKRSCDSPPPKYGGKDCDGPSQENRSCREIECPGSLGIIFLEAIRYILSFLSSKELKRKIHLTKSRQLNKV